MRIAFLWATNPALEGSWSGTPHSMYTELKKSHSIEWVHVRPSIFVSVLLVAARTCFKLAKRRFSYQHTLLYSKSVGRRLSLRLRSDFDVLFAPAAAQWIAFLQTTIPIVYVSDATVRALRDYYPRFTGLARFNQTQGDIIEERALSNADRVIASSTWARDSMIVDYGTPGEKITIAEFGPNLHLPAEIQRNSHEDLHLLFAGTDWHRKGGAIAVETNRLLNEKYELKSYLFIAGCPIPTVLRGDTRLVSCGYLDKNKENEYGRLLELYADADLFILPTRAECAGVVFSEAAAMALPVVTYRTGGVANYVVDGLNGCLIDPASGAEEFAAAIATCVRGGLLNRLSMGAQRLSRDRLNWKQWRDNVNRVLAAAVDDSALTGSSDV